MARVIAQKLSEGLGKQVVVDNRPGGAGNIATELAIKAPADGHTALMGNIGPLTVNPSLYKLSFDPLSDLAPVTQIAAAPLLIVVHPSLPVTSLKGLIALARREPGRMSYSSAGAGSAPHLAGTLFNLQAKLDITHIPYKGAAPALIDLIAGQVQLSFPPLPSGAAHVKTGRLKALAVTSAKRSSLFPALPTASEAGLKDYEVTTWYGLLLPNGTPREIIARLHNETAKALRLADVTDKLTVDGAEPVGSTPEEFHELMRNETLKWAAVIKSSGMRAE